MIKKGMIDRFDPSCGFGFIFPDEANGQDVFFHANNGGTAVYDRFSLLELSGQVDTRKLVPGAKVSYEQGENAKGLFAKRYWLTRNLPQLVRWRILLIDNNGEKKTLTEFKDLGVLNLFAPRTATSMDRFSYWIEQGNLCFEFYLPDETSDAPPSERDWLAHHGDPRTFVSWNHAMPDSMRKALLRWAAYNTYSDDRLKSVLHEIGCRSHVITSRREMGSPSEQYISIQTRTPDGRPIKI